MRELLGRTNRSFADIWWRIVGTDESQIEGVREAYSQATAPVMAGPYWANALRDLSPEWIVSGGAVAGTALSQSHADDLVSAQILQSVSSSPDGQLLIFFLSVDSAWEEYQINGALAAMDAARQDGLIRHLGLHVAGPAIAVSSLWRFHDAFEVVLASNQDLQDFATIRATALERRVGLILDGQGDHAPRLVEVATAAQMQEASR